MESDLTERLAAKLEEGIAAKLPYEERAERLGKWGSFIPEFALEVSTWADQLLAFLLSEPELVAGLPMETKVALTCQLLGDGDLRLSVLTERERAVMKLGEADLRRMASEEAGEGRRDWEAAINAYHAALAEARALPPSPPSEVR